MTEASVEHDLSFLTDRVAGALVRSSCLIDMLNLNLFARLPRKEKLVSYQLYSTLKFYTEGIPCILH
jgi:hypothetical protein